MSRRPRALAAAVALAPSLLAAQSADLDEERSSWSYRWLVSVKSGEPGKAPGFAALALSPEVAARCQPDLRDLRLLEPGGREVQYVIDRAVERESAPTWSGTLADARREARDLSLWVVDLGEPRGFDRVTLEVREQDFAKKVRVEVSDEGSAWRVVRDDASVFDRPWNGRVHHTTIVLPERVTARYVRLTLDDRRSRPVRLRGVVVSASRKVLGEEWRRRVGLQPARSGDSSSRYRLDLPPNFPFEVFELDTDEPAFTRRVVLYEVRESSGHREEVVLGEGNLYRLRLADEALSGEALELPIRRPQGGELILEVHDGDSPPLRNIRGYVSSAATRVLFPAVSGALNLYCGNDATRAPLYDLESLKDRLGLSPTFLAAELGPETENPRFRKPAPLPFAPSRGSQLSVTRWRALRPLVIAGREDLYTLTLAADDMALLRPDLGDLRIVDPSDRQVPYIVESAAAEARVELRVERTGTVRPQARSVSRYVLVAPGPASRKPPAFPLSALELTFQEAFFTRAARLLAPPPSGSRGRERQIFSGTLSRRPDPRGRPPADPIVLGLDGRAESELLLEIDEGDNAPLTLVHARGVVRVARVAFKAGLGEYRLLMGNRQAEPPRYDFASLRQEILSYSAVPAAAGPAQANPAFRRLAAEYFRDAPPTLLLWATLLGAVAALLLLTARVLRQPPA